MINQELHRQSLCEICGKKFKPFYCSSGRFCSQKCNTQHQQKKNDITGQKFHRLTAVSRMWKNKHRGWQWLFQCDCGKTMKSRPTPVKAGIVKSCGCLNREICRKKRKEKSPQWKGEDAKMASIQRWIGKNFPKTGKCAFCGGFSRHRFPWGKATRNINDYYEACMSCAKSQVKDESTVVRKTITSKELRQYYHVHA